MHPPVPAAKARRFSSAFASHARSKSSPKPRLPGLLGWAQCRDLCIPFSSPACSHFKARDGCGPGCGPGPGVLEGSCTRVWCLVMELRAATAAHSILRGLWIAVCEEVLEPRFSCLCLTCMRCMPSLQATLSHRGKQTESSMLPPSAYRSQKPLDQLFLRGADVENHGEA